MTHALHFATKLNSRDIQKCNSFWVPSYDLFASASACKAVLPMPAVTGVHRLRSMWSEKQFATSLTGGTPPPPNQKFLDPPCIGYC